MAVDKGLFIQPTAGGVGTTPVAARRNLAALLTPDGDLGVVPGVVSGLTVTGVASGWTYQVTAGHAVTTRGATDGAVVLSVDGNTNTPAPVLAGGGAGSTSAPVSGSRYELIWILQRDLDNGEADNIAAIGVTQGTASGSPVRPVVPTGALVIAEALVPTGAANTAAGSVTITSVAAKVGLRGGIVSVANTTQRNLLNSFATAATPVYADVLSEGVIYRSVGSGWKAVSSLGQTLHNEIVSTITGPGAGDIIVSGCPITLTPGTWEVTAGVTAVAFAGVEVAVATVYNVAGAAWVPFSAGSAGSVTTTTFASLSSRPATITVAVDTVVCPFAGRNSTGTLQIQAAAGSPSAWINARRLA